MTGIETPSRRMWPRSIRAFASRDFRYFLGGGLVSSIGTNMQIAALAWVVQQHTGSATKTTAIAFIGIVPLLLFGPAAGVLADRLPRRKLLVVTNLLNGAQAVALWAFWVSGSGNNYWLLFGLSALGGIFTAIQTPAWQSLPSELVERDHLINAITLNSTQFNISRALGPLCAGLAIDAFGAGATFLLNAMSYLAVIAALLAMSPAPPVIAPTDGLTIWQRFRDGLTYIYDRPVPRLVMGAHMVFAFIVPPVIYLIPRFSQHELRISASRHGLLLGVFGFGAIAAAVVLGHHEDTLRKSQAIAFGLIAGATALATLAAPPHYVSAIVAMIVLGVAYLIVASVHHGAIQTFTADAYRGRVTSVWLMTFGACMPMGVIAQGALTDRLGVRWVFAADAIMLVSLVGWLHTRGVLGRLDQPTGH